MKTITLIVGLPNSGKTTHGKNFKDVIHLDDCMKKYGASWKKEVVNKVNSSEEDVCMEGIMIKAAYRKKFLDAFKDYEYKKVCIWITTPIEKCIERSSIEGNKPEYVVKAVAKVFEPIAEEEGWNEIVEINRE